MCLDLKPNVILGCGEKSLGKLFADVLQNGDDPADPCASNQMYAQMLNDEPYAHVWSQADIYHEQLN